MKEQIVITNIPIKLPFNSTILYTFLMWYFKVDNLWWGIFICLFSIYWILLLIVFFLQRGINLNNPLPSVGDNHFNAKVRFLKNLRTSLEFNSHR